MKRAYILKKKMSGRLNDTKWYEIFDWLSGSRVHFEIKLLLSNDPIKSKDVYELERSEVMVDDSGNFIAFIEIASITFERNEETIMFLQCENVEFSDNIETIRVDGYSGLN